eukprot:TRINITY_DN26026_c0_g1_i1.p1 TRINITY_DN26026_c0_g1~~TRINITY_DN26026_c0_g1_i1.p1  ORF type:complete len:126 (+),score=20.33 TRINITY_DN26026_c0_g1_i1:33-410(+)
MIRRPPRSTLSSSSAASDVYKRQVEDNPLHEEAIGVANPMRHRWNGIQLIQERWGRGGTVIDQQRPNGDEHDESFKGEFLCLEHAACQCLEHDKRGRAQQPGGGALPYAVVVACLLYTSPSPRDS